MDQHILTMDQIRSNDHIPTEEIRRDIADTLVEIKAMESELVHLEATPQMSRDYRLNMLKASARRTGISDRKAFIDKLNQLIQYREAGSRMEEELEHLYSSEK